MWESWQVLFWIKIKTKIQCDFFEKATFKFFKKEISFKEIIFIQNIKITRWYLRVTMRLMTGDWKKLQTKAAFWRFFAGLRGSASIKILLFFCSIYNSSKSFQLCYSSNEQLVKICLLLNNFKKFCFFRINYYSDYISDLYRFVCLLNSSKAKYITLSTVFYLQVLFFSCCCSSALIWNLKAYWEDQQRWPTWKRNFQP